MPKTMGQITIKTLDLRKFSEGNSTERLAFARELGKCCEEIGFLVITGHPISAEQQQHVYQTIEKFFNLPIETKKRYELQGRAGTRGYISFGKEHAKDSKVGDLKEFFHLGMELPAGHPYQNSEDYPPNVKVPEVEEFDSTLRKIYADLNSLGMEILRAIALFLELPENYFDEKVRYGNSILRPIHYPPLTGQEAPHSVRAGAHEDINLITLLIGASSPGLQVVTAQKEWIPVTAKPSEIVVNVGDMLQRLTNRKLVSTTHRVVNPEFKAGMQNEKRFSVPFFLHPISEMSLAALPKCVSAENPAQEPPILAGEYLDQRLKEIGLLEAKK
jgi:isopenicillin N synthase-like dioxygenase